MAVDGHKIAGDCDLDKYLGICTSVIFLSVALLLISFLPLITCPPPPCLCHSFPSLFLLFYRFPFLLSSLSLFYIPSFCRFLYFFILVSCLHCALPSFFFVISLFSLLQFYILFIFVLHAILACCLSHLRTFLMQDHTITFLLLSRMSPPR